MSGTRLHSFREGDRSEYLAVYVLSALGLVTQVPRQEDIGFDLVCSIADQEEGKLTFNHQYVVSIKSVSSPNIDLLPPNNWDGVDPVHMTWFFDLDLPLMLAAVDKEKQAVMLYSTGAALLIPYTIGVRCGSISLVPRVYSVETANDVHPKRMRDLEGFPNKGHYNGDLGHPMEVITTDDLKDKERLRRVKEKLRDVMDHSKLSLRYYKMGVPYFYWFSHTTADCSKYLASFICRAIPHNQGVKENLLMELYPMLICLASYYKMMGETLSFAAVAVLLKAVPLQAVHQTVRDAFPEIFGV